MASTLLTIADKESEQERHNTDLLTGLRSRSYFNDLLAKLDLLIAACPPPSKPVVLIIGIDLHLPGFLGTTEDTIEKWLPQLARCISQALTYFKESNDWTGPVHACRYQGNQIAILLETATPAAVELLAKAIDERIQAQKKWAADREEMSVSIGVTPCSQGQKAEAVLNQCLLALNYTVRDNRRGAVHFLSPGPTKLHTKEKCCHRWRTRGARQFQLAPVDCGKCQNWDINCEKQLRNYFRQHLGPRQNGKHKTRKQLRNGRFK